MYSFGDKYDNYELRLHELAFNAMKSFTKIFFEVLFFFVFKLIWLLALDERDFWHSSHWHLYATEIKGFLVKIPSNVKVFGCGPFFKIMRGVREPCTRGRSGAVFQIYANVYGAV